MFGDFLSLYGVLFTAGLCFVLVLELSKTRNGIVIDNTEYKKFRDGYLLVFSLVMAGDWLQGPYVYALYEHYGYHMGDIATLYIAGYASSLVVGTLVGSLADKFGRRNSALLFVLIYSLSCATKHSAMFAVLFVGRLLGGIATSLLFSVFESWLCTEHVKRTGRPTGLQDGALTPNAMQAPVGVMRPRTPKLFTPPPSSPGGKHPLRPASHELSQPPNLEGLAQLLVASERRAEHIPDEWLDDTFSYASLLGNGAMAITAGIIGNMLVATPLGPVAPFDAAALCLLTAGSIILFEWDENFGESEMQGDGLFIQIMEGVAVIRKDAAVATLGAMQGLFEGGLHSFVFLWTPALTQHGATVPHGLVFACMMVACMAGSSLVGALNARGVRPAAYMKLVFLAAAACMVVCIPFNLERVVSTHRHADAHVDLAGSAHERDWLGMPLGNLVQLLAFMMFEFLVGMFWPAMMTQRSEHVPDGMRATILNLFRVPVNVSVCLVLARVHLTPLSVMFGVCALLMIGCLALQFRLARLHPKDRDLDPYHASLKSELSLTDLR